MSSTRDLVRFVAVLLLLFVDAVAQSTLYVPAQHPTIQAAVNASAPGDTIRVASGIYEEQVIIVSKDLTLIGSPGAVIRAPNNMAQTLLPASARRAIVGIFGAHVVVRHFVIDGALRGNTNPDFNGIVYLGASGRTQHCHIRGVRNDPLSPGGSSAPLRAINLLAFGTPVVNVAFLDNVCEDNFDGIALSGDDGSPNLVRIHATVRGNVVRGPGPTNAVVQNGIWMMFGVDGLVKWNLVRDFDSTDPFAVSVGIAGGVNDLPGLEMPEIHYIGNVLIDNEVGIGAIFSREARIAGNFVTGSSFAGIAVSGPENRVLLNLITDSTIGVGLAGDESVVFGTAIDTRVLWNRIHGCVVPIRQETGVTGTIAFGNHIVP